MNLFSFIAIRFTVIYQGHSGEKIKFLIERGPITWHKIADCIVEEPIYYHSVQVSSGEYEL